MARKMTALWTLALALPFPWLRVGLACPAQAGSLPERCTCAVAPRCLEQLQQEERRQGTLDGQGSRWIASESVPLCGVALVVHGLNLRPARMDDIAGFLARGGVSSLRLTLPGHGGDPARMKAVTRRLWLDHLFSGYCVARALAAEQRVPLYLVGYSLGALLGLDLQNNASYGEVAFDRSVLLAPASNLRRYVWLIRALGFAPNLVVPARSRPENRACPRGTAMAAYNALFDSYQALRATGLAQASNPTLVLVDRDDELISVGSIRRVSTMPGLDWRVVVLEDKEPHTLRTHHLIVVRSALGEQQWRTLTDAIAAHLGLSGQPPEPETDSPQSGPPPAAGQF